MLFKVNRLMLLLYIATLSACMPTYSYKDYLEVNEGKSAAQFKYHHRLSQFNVDWNIFQIGADTVIEGRLVNMGKIRAEDVNLDIVVLEPGGLELIRESAHQSYLNKSESFRFNIKLKNFKIKNQNNLQFSTEFRASDGRWGGRGMRGTFMVEALTGTDVKIGSPQISSPQELQEF